MPLKLSSTSLTGTTPTSTASLPFKSANSFVTLLSIFGSDLQLHQLPSQREPFQHLLYFQQPAEDSITSERMECRGWKSQTTAPGPLLEASALTKRSGLESRTVKNCRNQAVLPESPSMNHLKIQSLSALITSCRDHRDKMTFSRLSRRPPLSDCKIITCRVPQSKGLTRGVNVRNREQIQNTARWNKHSSHYHKMRMIGFRWI